VNNDTQVDSGVGALVIHDLSEVPRVYLEFSVFMQSDHGGEPYYAA
jgi:hypothetical protein